jgi:hypothetical protein
MNLVLSKIKIERISRLLHNEPPIVLCLKVIVVLEREVEAAGTLRCARDST